MVLEAEDLRRGQMSSCGLVERRSALKSLPDDGVASTIHRPVKYRAHSDSQISCHEFQMEEDSGTARINRI